MAARSLSKLSHQGLLCPASFSLFKLSGVRMSQPAGSIPCQDGTLLAFSQHRLYLNTLVSGISSCLLSLWPNVAHNPQPWCSADRALCHKPPAPYFVRDAAAA